MFKFFLCLIIGLFVVLSCDSERGINTNIIQEPDDREQKNIIDSLELIDSIYVVPTSSAGKVWIRKEQTKVHFKITPPELLHYLSKIDITCFTLEFVSTDTIIKGLELAINSVCSEDELLAVEMTTVNLPETISHEIGMSCRLNITNGVSNVSSLPFFLALEAEPTEIFFKLQDTEGNVFEPFLVEDGLIHVNVPNGTDLVSLLPVLSNDNVYVSSTGESMGNSFIDFSDFVNPFTFRQISSEGKEITWTVILYNLPVVIVNTPDSLPIESKSERINGTMIRIVENGVVKSIGTAGIRGRGNTTWELAKKPYNIKLDKKYPICGMTSSKNWLLLANAYYDRTQLHNATAFELARLTDYPWVQSGEFVELFLNGKHKGLYYMCEKIREGKNTINIGNGVLMESVVSGVIIPELVYSDYYYDVWCGRWRLGWEIKSPENITPELFSDVSKSLNYMDSLIFNEENLHTGKYRNYFDIETAINWFLVEEVAQNEEASRSKNIYIYKDDTGLWKMGPPWDFDAWTFGLYGTGHFYCTGSLYFPSLLKDAYFVNRLKEKWNHYKQIWLEHIPHFIETQYEKIHLAAERNDLMWPDWCPENRAWERTYRQSIEAMKEAIVEQINWMDVKIQNEDFTN